MIFSILTGASLPCRSKSEIRLVSYFPEHPTTGAVGESEGPGAGEASTSGRMCQHDVQVSRQGIHDLHVAARWNEAAACNCR